MMLRQPREINFTYQIDCFTALCLVLTEFAYAPPREDMQNHIKAIRFVSTPQ